MYDEKSLKATLLEGATHLSRETLSDFRLSLTMRLENPWRRKHNPYSIYKEEGASTRKQWMLKHWSISVTTAAVTQVNGR